MTPSSSTESRLKTRPEVARELHVSLRTIDKLLAARAIDHVRVGGAVRFTAEHVEKYLQSRTVTAVA